MAAEGAKKRYKLEEVAGHNHTKALWVVIHDKVYDVTEFAGEHPGGVEVLLENAGKNATAAFEDVGHSTDAKDLMKKYEIGVLHEDDRKKSSDESEHKKSGPRGGGGQSESSWLSWLIPLAVAAVVTFAYRYFSHASGHAAFTPPRT